MAAFFKKITARLGQFSGNTDLAFILGLFGAIVLLVIPIHKDLLSLLLVVGIGIRAARRRSAAAVV